MSREGPVGSDQIRLGVHGELDVYTAPRLRSQLRACKRAGAGVVLDLDDVSFIDSSGLAVLVQAMTDAAADGWQLQLDGASDAVRSLFKRTGLTDMLRVEPLEHPS